MREKSNDNANITKKEMLDKAIKLLKRNELVESEKLLEMIVGKYPHDPEPHNLFGILFEKKLNHSMAMKHFRAAWALDSTYLPARHNLELYGTFFSNGRCAYDNSDCVEFKNNNNFEVEYDEHNIGRVNRRNK